MNATANDDLGNLSMARSDAVCAFLSIDERTLRNVLRASEEAGIDVPSVGTGTGRRWFPDRRQTREGLDLVDLFERYKVHQKDVMEVKPRTGQKIVVAERRGPRGLTTRCKPLRH